MCREKGPRREAGPVEFLRVKTVNFLHPPSPGRTVPWDGEEGRVVFPRTGENPMLRRVPPLLLFEGPPLGAGRLHCWGEKGREEQHKKKPQGVVYKRGHGGGEDTRGVWKGPVRGSRGTETSSMGKMQIHHGQHAMHWAQWGAMRTGRAVGGQRQVNPPSPGRTVPWDGEEGRVVFPRTGENPMLRRVPPVLLFEGPPLGAGRLHS